MLDRQILLDTQKHCKTTRTQRTAQETYSTTDLEITTHRDTDKTRTKKMKVGIQRLKNR